MPAYLKVLTVAFCFFLLSFLTITPTIAQDLGIKVSPSKVEVVVDPGEIINESVTVVNESDVPVTFYVYLRDFKAEGETGSPKLIEPGSEDGYYLASWIDITKEGINFNPRESITIPFSVKVPDNVGPGGYFGAILFGTEPPRLQLSSEERGAGMGIGQQTASLVLLRVAGEVDERAQIREFNTNKDFYSTPYNVNFLLRIQNEGNVHIKPFGQIVITNMLGREAASIKVNENGGNVLPDSTRKFTDILWQGTNGFGLYTATLGLSYGINVDEGGQGKRSLFAQKSFWIIPWGIIIPIFATLIFISGVLILLLRLYKNKAIRQAMERAGLGHVRYVPKYEGPSPALHISVILLVVLVILFLVMTGVYFLFFA